MSIFSVVHMCFFSFTWLFLIRLCAHLFYGRSGDIADGEASLYMSLCAYLRFFSSYLGLFTTKCVQETINDFTAFFITCSIYIY